VSDGKQEPRVLKNQAPRNDDKCDKCGFLLEEYKALRKEIELYIAEVRGLERYSIVAIGAVWGWLSANRIEHPVPWMIPLILSIGVGLRGLVILVHFKRISKYIYGIESAFDVNGWEHQFRASMPVRGMAWMSISTASLLVGADSSFLAGF